MDARETDRPNIFVNREGPIGKFKEAVAAIPTDRSIIRVFHGPGGQGKSALCRHLHGIDLPKDKANGQQPHRALIDLHGEPNRDIEYWLVKIRNDWSGKRVSFAAFDLAMAIMWEATRAHEPFPTLKNAWLGRSADALTQSAPDVVQTLREVVEKTVETIPGIGFLMTKGAGWAINKGKEQWLLRSRKHLQRLFRGDEIRKPHELREILPWMLAQDLNHHIAAYDQERFILLVDEYESLFDQRGASDMIQNIPLDAMLKKLASETNGLLLAFFMRERLPWERESNWRDDVEDQHIPLDGLTDDYADEWLLKAEVDNEKIRRAIVEGARENDQPDALVYPLLLNLQIEHWRNLKTNGRMITPDIFENVSGTFDQRCEKIVKSLLDGFDENRRFLFERLSVANRFDREAFEFALGQIQNRTFSRHF